MGNVNLNSIDGQNIGGDVVGNNKTINITINNYLTSLSSKEETILKSGFPRVDENTIIKAVHFQHELFWEDLLYKQNLSLQTGDEFVQPDEFLNPLYYPNRLKATVKDKTNNLNTLELPYQEEIDFISEPRATLEIINKPTLHNLSRDLEDVTEEHLKAFRKAKPDSRHDYKLARLAYFSKLMMKNINAAWKNLVFLSKLEQI